MRDLLGSPGPPPPELFPVMGMDVNMPHSAMMMSVPVRKPGLFEQRHIAQRLRHKSVKQDMSFRTEYDCTLAEFRCQRQVVGGDDQRLVAVQQQVDQSADGGRVK